MRALALVVVERGSTWPRCVHTEDVDVTAVVQAEGESRDALLRRVVAHATRAIRRGLRLVVLACNGESGDESTQRRGILARALLATVMSVEGGHLVLSASEQAPSSVRHELLGVTSTLSEWLTGSSVSVSVRFEPERPQRRHNGAISHASAIAR